MRNGLLASIALEDAVSHLGLAAVLSTMIRVPQSRE